ncbi:MAG: hypothetical protein LBM07_08755 [Culturomica sp.]|jgi:hypothetical protein|nr:hypothetical protein [Culturomica sp.]
MENKNDILKNLYSEDPSIKEDAIKAIETNGDLSVVPALFDYLQKSDDKLPVVKLLSDIKLAGFQGLVIDRLETSPPEILTYLLRVVWESSLDFSDYADTFVEFLMTKPLEIALEAATVLENLSFKTAEERENVIEMLQATPKHTENQFLIENVLEVLTNPIEQEDF